MVRLDRARLDKGVFPHRCAVTTRFADLDSVGHLNNVAISEILQEGRYRFMVESGMWGAPGRHVVMASLLIEYAGDLLHPAPVEIATGVLEIGRTSLRMAQVALQHERIGAYAEAALVIRGDSGPIPIPEDWRAKLEELKIK